MIGYHYTTKETWEDHISIVGLTPRTIRVHEFKEFRKGLPTLPHEAIWVWKETLTDVNAWITVTSLAVMHSSFEIVLLEVEYGEKDAASVQCLSPQDKAEGTTTKLTCNFSIRDLSTGKLPIELLLDPIPTQRIKRIWVCNLLTPMCNRHSWNVPEEAFA